jgi:type III restriction enzyme
MLYEEFDSYKKFAGLDVFKNKATEKVEVLKNLNQTFSIREYQKEALGRFYYYCEEYKQKQKPTHLMFNMATGSGKTLIMAANILYLYQKGYRNFIFFTRLGNIIQKTKANFLDPNSKKYLFSEKIILNGQQIKVQEVENFEGVNNDDINIVFSTTALLHSRFNFARENVLTYEDFADKKIVLIADEAHNLSAETNNKHTETEEEERRNWENTVMQILNANSQKENMLLEFTATARLEQEYLEILEKYKDKAIFRYDLKEYRLDGFSKDVRTLQINASLMERALSAVVISQYRRKIAEKHKIALKPVIMFKANRVTPPKNRTELQGDNPQVIVSGEFKEAFHLLISNLTAEKLKQLFTINDSTLQMATKFFKEQKISIENLVEEIKSDFAPEKCLSVDENKDVEQKQLLLNSLEDKDNEIRAVFATEKLNEGWDVLNLFDIVRLYNSRDAVSNKPGKTTVQEAQLIGRGARYCPFVTGEFTDLYRRKFDSDVKNELRIIEQLYYHSVTNSRYIQELETVLVKEGILPSRTIQRELKIKDKFKDKNFWKNGYVYLNKQEVNLGKDVWALEDVKAVFNHNEEVNIYSLPTREVIERDVFTGFETINSQREIETKEFNITDFGQNIVRAALSRLVTGRFSELKKIFGNLESVNDFINNQNYLGKVKIKVKGTTEQLDNLLQIEKIKIASFVLEKVLGEAGKEKKEYIGTKEFKMNLIKEIFKDKILQLDEDSPRAQNMRDFDFSNRDWFAQNEIWGTSEEESFLKFINGIVIKLQKKYQEIALLRNEQFFKIYNFEDGQPFSPDFVLFLKEKKSKREIVYQVFIEPKGNEFFDEDNRFEKSKEGWKQKFLTEIGKQGLIELRLNFENQDYKLIGLPFYNEGIKNNILRKEFEEVFDKQVLSNKC